VSAASPSSAAATSTALAPDPGEGLHDALAPYAVVGPYSKRHSLTSAPLGSTVAASVARVCVIAAGARG